MAWYWLLLIVSASFTAGFIISGIFVSREFADESYR